MVATGAAKELAMKLVRIVEFAAGWLAVFTGGAMTLAIWKGSYISPDSVGLDLTIFGVILAVIALSVTLESVIGSVMARITLAIGALALTAVFVVSFVIELGIPALLAIGATFVALARHLPPPAPRRISA
jgi:hypothetical protein